MNELSKVAGGVADDQLDPEAFLRGMRAQMSPSSQRTMEALERVKNVYVASGRDLVVAKQFERFMEWILAERNGRREAGRIFFVTGASRAGKTEIVRRMIKNESSLREKQTGFGVIRPCVSISLKGFTHPRIVARNILSAAGYPIRHDTARGEIWDGLATRLKSRFVTLVHIDETQHMIRKNPNAAEREALADAIKGLTNDEDWPVSLILSGLPRTAEIAKLDEQFEGRGAFFRVPDVDIERERKLVLEIIRQMADAGGLALGALLEGDVPERIAHGARYRYGRICQIVLAGIHAAFRRGASVLAIEHFAEAYLDHSHARGFDGMNLFLIDDWKRLPVGSFLIGDDDVEDEE